MTFDEYRMENERLFMEWKRREQELLSLRRKFKELEESAQEPLLREMTKLCNAMDDLDIAWENQKKGIKK